MIYDFRMKQLLQLFDDNSETLVAEFTKQLNSELKKKNALSESKNEVVKSWNSFLKSYFDIYPLPDNITLKDIEIKSENIEEILKLVLELVPCVNSISDNIDKVKKKTVAVIEDVSTTIDDWLNKHTN